MPPPAALDHGIQALLLLGDGLEESGSLDGKGRQVGEGGEEADIVLAESVRRFAVDRQDADDLALIHDRHGQAGAPLGLHLLGEAGLCQGIVDEGRLSPLNHDSAEGVRRGWKSAILPPRASYSAHHESSLFPVVEADAAPLGVGDHAGPLGHRLQRLL